MLNLMPSIVKEVTFELDKGQSPSMYKIELVNGAYIVMQDTKGIASKQETKIHVAA